MMKTDLVVVNPRRECYSCGSTETYVGRQKTSSKPHHHWYGNGISDQWLCLRCENHLIKGPRYHPFTNPRTHKKNHKSCNCNCGHRAKPSSGVTDNYSPPSTPLPSSMEEVVRVRGRVSQFAQTKTNKQQSNCGGSVI